MWYRNSETNAKNNNVLLTPIKDKKGWEALLKQLDLAFNKLFNKAVSSVRQPIESLFNRINEMTQIKMLQKLDPKMGLNYTCMERLL